MHINLEEKIYEKRFLLIVLAIIALINIVSNYLAEDIAIKIGSYLLIAASGILMIFSFAICYKFGVVGRHGIAWMMFVCFSTSWFVAETIWVAYDLYFELDPFPSIADLFYIVGYPFLFIFILFYLKPVREGISRRITMIAIFLSLVILTSSLIAIGLDIESDKFDVVGEKNFDFLGFGIALIYPILDAIVLVPAIIGLFLFFKGQVSFLWSLMCLAIISVGIADSAFVLGHVDEFYHTGHHIDIFFLWPYALMSFGIFNHYSLFQSRK